MVSGFGHLAWDSTREKKRIHEVDGAIETSESSQLRNETEANKRSNRKEKKQHGKHTSINMAYDAHSSMMHVRFNYAWHGKVHKQVLQVKWSSICNELHIDETPHIII